MSTEQHDWNPRDPLVLADQRRAYDEMREQCPIAHSEFMGWSVFRHEDVVAVLADPTTYSSASKRIAIPNGMDPPEHRRYREALAPHFTDERMAALEPRSRQIAQELVEAMLAQGEVGFMDAFATPFPLRTLCAFLGWPEDQWESLGGWTHGNEQAAFTRDRAAGKALASLLAEHVKANLDVHRMPDEVSDVTDALLATDVDGQRLNDEQIISTLRNWIAGEGTVAAALSVVVLYLANRPDLQEQLRADPSLIAAAIEEILRVDDPLVANRRTVTREVEIQGRTIPAGENLTLMWIAANRDPRAFDDADAVRIDRETTDGMVWGQGIHLCLGASMARMEMRVALEVLLSETKLFELAGEAPRRTVYPSNGLAALPLRFS